MTTELDQLAAARPVGPSDDLYSPAERHELLASITARPRASTARGPVRMRRRVVVAAVTVAAAAVAGTVVAQPWHRSNPRYGSAVYTVDKHSDGTFRIVIHWSELKDPTKLQAELDLVGAPVRILTGTYTAAGTPIPPCAEPFSGVGYSAAAVQWDFPDRASEVNGIVVRPQHFPEHGTFVIEAYTGPGERRYTPDVTFMAVGAVPTCVVPVAITYH